ncbi:hypothetical protein [Alteribacillus bidgolensis]|uniref:Uncharacterized protein n=1 Tax=Alteribacillus bidgolensis TaxID=930129 RepID=A0A1G8IDQ0_9BACI|nr:hypothetical protein [Alteribacillus bidgolensis]SDI16927.1 hypothetical protein SAMN05216352_105147 [Alteribacillus bidgolensis]
MNPLKALSVIVVLASVMILGPLLTGSNITIFYLPLNIFILWILYLIVIPIIWYLVKKVKIES